MSVEYLYDVFLSHSAKDKAVVRPLAERLRNDGIKVWFDEWVIKPGDSIPSKVEEGLERSRVLVLSLSANAFGSDWAQMEFDTFGCCNPPIKQWLLPLRFIRGEDIDPFSYVNVTRTFSYAQHYYRSSHLRHAVWQVSPFCRKER